MQQIQNYVILPNKRGRDLAQKIFGDFLVLYRTLPLSSSKQAHWLCQCQNCQKYTVIPAYTLLNGTNECSCRFDLTNKTYGRWTVLYFTGRTAKNRSKIWHCKCDCGNEKDIDGYILRSGQSRSCGCLQKETIKKIAESQRIDLTGQRFGKLVALKPIYGHQEGKHTQWECQCDCGNKIFVDMGNLQQGFSKSCGCTLSRQEENIIKLLTTANICFVYQKRFEDFSTKRFDFWVPEQNYIIEFDGEQHFFADNHGWNTQEKFEKTRQNDLLKNQYCFINNIPLIRIPYDVNYTLEDLQLETTHFLLTKENEENYYSSRIKT